MLSDGNDAKETTLSIDWQVAYTNRTIVGIRFICTRIGWYNNHGGASAVGPGHQVKDVHEVPLLKGPRIALM